MELRLERNGRIWNNKGKREEVLDVFYGVGLTDKLSRGICNDAFKQLIPDPLKKGEALIINLEVLSKIKRVA